jgi:integrase
VGRPGLVLGTAGTVRIYPAPNGYKAVTRYRDWDGTVRQVKRHGVTKGAARRNLAAAIRDRSSGSSGIEINGETKLAVLSEVWFEEIRGRDLSPSTVQAYRDRLDKQILPAMGELKIRELSVGVVDRHISAVKAKHGPSLAKTTRSVLSGICALACRHDALATNPCRDVARISTKPKRPPTALTADDLRRLHQWLSSDEQSIERDLPDLVLFLAATGLRIGEALAVQWADVGLDEGTVEVRGTVLRLRAGGLVIKPSPKSAAGRRILELPSWAVIMLRRRQPDDVSEDELARQVFPAPVAGGIRDPSNTLKMMRQAFKHAGFDGVTSHYFRKTVATLMDEAGLSARSAADQLGHAKPSLTADIYMGRKKRATGAAEVLEDLFQP